MALVCDGGCLAAPEPRLYLVCIPPLISKRELIIYLGAVSKAASACESSSLSPASLTLLLLLPHAQTSVGTHPPSSRPPVSPSGPWTCWASPGWCWHWHGSRTPLPAGSAGSAGVGLCVFRPHQLTLLVTRHHRPRTSVPAGLG